MSLKPGVWSSSRACIRTALMKAHTAQATDKRAMMIRPGLCIAVLHADPLSDDCLQGVQEEGEAQRPQHHRKDDDAFDRPVSQLAHHPGHDRKSAGSGKSVPVTEEH